MIAAWALTVALAAPPTLGEALRAIGAFPPDAPPAPETVDLSLQPPPSPPRLAAKALIGTGALVFLGGLVGTIVSPRCATQNADRECVDARGAHPAFPALMVAGIAAAVVGSAWYREDAPP